MFGPALGTVIAFALASFAAEATSLVSGSDVHAVLCSIETYGTSGDWPQSQLDIVRNTLELEIENYTPPSPTLTTASTDAACTVTAYSQVATALSSCTDIHISNLTVPGNTTLDLSEAQANTVITFEGRTFWEYANASYNLMKLGGTNVTVQGAACSVLDGNGAAWWDGIGSNGGVPKPNDMIVGSKLLGNSIIKNLYVKNAPTHVFSISGSFGLVVQAVVIDNKDGYTILPSNGLEAAHNTDGFDISSSTDMLVSNNVVFNQDDCVAVTSGGGYLITNFYCYGGHGLSIGSIGGKSNNTVDGVVFSNSQVLNSQNGVRIKTNSGTTGVVNNVTYDNIQVSNVSIYGLDIQQDYLNGGPTGIPTNGVNITNIVMENIQGTAQSGAENYYLLVGNETTPATWTFSNIDITGGSKSSCNVLPAGFAC